MRAEINFHPLNFLHNDPFPFWIRAALSETVSEHTEEDFECNASASVSVNNAALCMQL